MNSFHYTVGRINARVYSYIVREMHRKMRLERIFSNLLGLLDY